MNENQTTHFNEKAKTWDTPEKIEKAAFYGRKIKEVLHKDHFSKVLEIGCGTGLLGSQFWQSNSQYVGLDTSSEMLSVLHSKCDEKDLVRSYLVNMDTEEVPEKDFDLVVSSMAFHHLKDPKNTVQRLAPHLSANAAVAVIDLRSEDGSFHPDPQGMGVHHSGFSEEEIRAWATALGAEVLYLDTIHTVQKNGKEYPLFLTVFRKR